FLERLIFGLRMNEGIDLVMLEKDLRFNLPADTRKNMDDLIQGGFLAADDGRIKTTLRGRLVLDEIAGRLI
ncbi:MAG: coproporphyrinogen III oxidase, partial [Candidatus Omnitrophica bacterium]|nr:coproporphyrinogen III oxidase [Candidatus Omnitrophota bacterium]